MTLESFERNFQKDVLRKLTKKIPAKAMIVAISLASEVEGHSIEELTAFAQNQLDQYSALRGKVEVKIMKIK